MSRCHCDEINEFATTAGPDTMTEAGALFDSEMDALIREDLEFHEHGHAHSRCRSVYDPDLGDTIYSLSEGCGWEGHDSALEEFGWCPTCQH